MRSMTFHINPTDFTAEQRAAAYGRLTEVGCPEGEIEALMGPLAGTETVSQKALATSSGSNLREQRR